MPRTTGPVLTDADLAYPVGGTHTMDVVDNDLRNLKGKIAQMLGGTTGAPQADSSFFASDDTRAGQIKPGFAPIYIGDDDDFSVPDEDPDDYPEIFGWAYDTGKLYLSYDDGLGGGYAWIEINPRQRAAAYQRLYELNEWTYEQQTNVAATWETINEDAVPTAATVTISIPTAAASDDWAEWAIEVDLGIYLGANTDAEPAVRMTYSYDGGADTYPKVYGADIRTNAPFLYHLHHRITGISDGAATDLGKDYVFGAEFSTQSGTDCYVNKAANAGADGDEPISWIKAVAYRVD